MLEKVERTREGSRLVNEVFLNISRGAEVAAYARLAEKLYFKDANSQEAEFIESALKKIELAYEDAKRAVSKDIEKRLIDKAVLGFVKDMQGGAEFGNMLSRVRENYGDDLVDGIEGVTWPSDAKESSKEEILEAESEPEEVDKG